MQRIIPILIAVFLAATAFAAPQTVTLSVPGMNCPACPITVKKALTAIEGVDKVEVAYEKREVTVTFDDTRATTAALIQATSDAGYPSSLKGGDQQ